MVVLDAVMEGSSITAEAIWGSVSLVLKSFLNFLTKAWPRSLTPAEFGSTANSRKSHRFPKLILFGVIEAAVLWEHSKVYKWF